MGELGFCNYHDILKAISTQFLIDSTTDTGWPLFLVRMLHNKLYYGVFYSLRCYFLYIDTAQFSLFFPPVLYPFIVYAFFGKKWRKRIWMSVLVMPILFIIFSSRIGLGEKILVFKIFYILIAIIGGIKIFVKIFDRNKRD